MTQPLASASRKLAVGAGRSEAVSAWDPEPIAEPSLELRLLVPPMTNSSYRFGRYEGSSERRAAAALTSDAAHSLRLVGLPPTAGSPRTVSRAARSSRNGRGRR